MKKNKQAIFSIIGSYLTGEVFEIGSGTGQHAVYFASKARDIVWQTS